MFHSFKRCLIVIFMMMLNLLAITIPANEFYFNTKNGFGIIGSIDMINYTIGFPYSEVGFKFPISNVGNMLVSTFGGYDFIRSTYFFKMSPDFSFNNLIISTPFELASKSITSDEATETGRFNVGLEVSYGVENVIFRISAYYSAFYLYYDPAFNVNIPTIHTDDIFRSSLDVRLTYKQPYYSITFGYYAILRWLSYRSSFITGENAGYIEGRFKVKF